MTPPLNRREKASPPAGQERVKRERLSANSRCVTRARAAVREAGFIPSVSRGEEEEAGEAHG